MCGPGSIVTVVTFAGWSRDRIPVGGEIFHTCPDQTWGPPSLLYNGYRVFPGGKEWQGSDADPFTFFYCRGQERVGLYLYSPYDPYGLYRVSVLVQGWPLPTLQHYVPEYLNNQCLKALFVTVLGVSKLPGILYHRWTVDVLLILVVFWWTRSPMRLFIVHYSFSCLLMLSVIKHLTLNPFQSNFSANRILPSSYLFRAGKRLVDYL
jgi:hypothetical protein